MSHPFLTDSKNLAIPTPKQRRLVNKNSDNISIGHRCNFFPRTLLETQGHTETQEQENISQAYRNCS